MTSELLNTSELLAKAKRIATTDDGRPMPYVLARLAGVSDPDFRGSPGALFLTGVFEGWLEAIAYDASDDPAAFLADLDREAIERDVTYGRAEMIYTVESWRVFTDLGLWTLQADDPCIVDGLPLVDVASALLEDRARALVSALFDALDQIGAK